ncbi:MAG: CvpA family protein [Betaproteobacteria bacterium]
MTALDWAIVSIVVASVLLGLLRGLLREVLSLAAWVVGAWLAFVHASTLGAWLPWDLWPAAKTALAALAIVAGCVLLAGLVAWVLRQLLAAVKLSGVDRLLGAVFGLARAALIIGIGVLLARGTEIARQPYWTESRLLPRLEGAVRWVAPRLPSPGQQA